MDLSDEPPPRRPLFFPVVIATVFLTIIGMSAGLVLGARAKQAAPDRSPSAPTPTAGQPDSAAGQPCRPETQAQGRLAGASGVLRIVLHVRTSSSAVWICADAEKRLYYHGNRGRGNPEWIEGTTALFLPGVIASGDGYQADVTGEQGTVTVFEVTRERLAIHHPGGRTEIQPVTAVLAG